MKTLFTRVAVAVVIVFAAAQAVRPNRTNPETKLSAKDVDIICAAARLSDSRVSAQRSQP